MQILVAGILDYTWKLSALRSSKQIMVDSASNNVYALYPDGFNETTNKGLL